MRVAREATVTFTVNIKFVVERSVLPALTTLKVDNIDSKIRRVFQDVPSYFLI